MRRLATFSLALVLVSPPTVDGKPGMFRAAAEYRRDGLEARVDLETVGRRVVHLAGEGPGGFERLSLSGYAMVHVRARWEVPQRWRMPGRSLRAGPVRVDPPLWCRCRVNSRDSARGHVERRPRSRPLPAGPTCGRVNGKKKQGP